MRITSGPWLFVPLLALAAACTATPPLPPTEGSAAATTAPGDPGTGATASAGGGSSEAPAAPEATAAAGGAQALAEDQLVLTFSGGLQASPVTLTADIGPAIVVSNRISMIFMPDEPIPVPGAQFPRLERFTFTIDGASAADYPLQADGATNFQFDIDFADTDGLDAFSLCPASGTVTIDSMADGHIYGHFTSVANPTQMNSTDVAYQVEGAFHVTWR